MYMKVKDAPGFVRGENSAVLSVNNTELDAYRKRRNYQKNMENALCDINNIKDEMVELKAMLGNIIGALNGQNR